MIFSDYSLFHELTTPQIHSWEDLALWVGVIGSLGGISIFVYLKIQNWKDKKKEYETFKEDFKDEIEYMSKIRMDGNIKYDEKTKQWLGNFFMVDFYSFESFNNKYRHLYNTNVREKIGRLKLAVKGHDEISSNIQGTFWDLHADNTTKEAIIPILIKQHNDSLKAISIQAKEIFEILETCEKSNLFKRQGKK